ncbi:MAG: carboxypeptidase-like regulatory domain-containing protein [Bacteroidetes bacterium]|nr:carboxypeptidase-like regulatory domain-containing protein [Bacteroidota bacterium]
MKQLILILALALTTGLVANNNEGKAKLAVVKGKVLDNQESLTGVKVMVDNVPTTVYTDFDGNFFINNLTIGKHTLSFSLVAYESKVIEIDVTASQNIEVKLDSK